MKLFLIEFRAHTGETQRLGKFGAKISESVKWKCQANLNHAEILYASAIPLEPSMTYDSEYVLYSDWYDNGHTVFDGFLMGDGVLYWASIDVGTPGGYTPEMIFANSGEEIEVLLHEMFMINMGRSKTDDIAVAALQAVLTEIPEGDIPAYRLNNICWNASLWNLAEDAMFGRWSSFDPNAQAKAKIRKGFSGDFMALHESPSYLG